VAHCHACHARYAEDVSQTYTARKAPEDRARQDRSRKIPHFVFFVPGDLDL